MLTEERVDELYDHREVLELGALHLAQQYDADLTEVADATRALRAMSLDAPWVDVVLAHQRVHHRLVQAAGNSKLLHAYVQCEDELHYVVSTVRPEFTATRLAELHTTLLAALQEGGVAATEALRRDLRAGRAAVLAGLRDRADMAS